VEHAAAVATVAGPSPHVIAPDFLRDGVDAARRQGCRVFLEIGPAPTLTVMGRHSIDADLVWLASLDPGAGDWDRMLQSVAAMYVHGVAVDWERFDRGYARRRLTLPTYPFQRQRCWFTEAPGMRPRGSGPAQESGRLEPEAALASEA
jgi:myxalamid-type polyketide synthase MxaE and MxaD